MKNNIFVYKKFKPHSDSLLNNELTVSNIKESFAALLNKLRLVREPFSYELFPQIVINIKWKFDYLTNIRANPLLLIKDLIYWHEQAEMFIKFQEEKWVNDKDINTNFQKTI